MNLILQNKIKAFIVAVTAVILGLFIGFLTSTTSAIPYNGEATEPSPVPAFNVYTGVPNVGNESDFYKGKVDGSTEDSVNDIKSTCETGKRFSLRAYVHNGASQYNNAEGTGPSVAQGTKIKMTVPGNEGSNFNSTATISSTNASAISDSLTITCTDGKKVTVKYVVGSAEQYSGLSGSQKVSDSIVTTGAPIGTMAPDGKLWGCWDQRVWVRIVVEVKEVPPVLHAAVCDALLATILGSNQVRVDDVKYTANNATVNNITLDYGDSTKNTVAPGAFPQAPHTYTKPGTYIVRATLNTTINGQAKEVTSDKCTFKVTVKEDQKTPVYACTDPKLVFNDRIATFSFIPTASNGAKFKDATIKYLADDKEVNVVTTDVVNSDGRVVSTYTFSSTAKNVDVNATLRFNVTENDKTTVKEAKCSKEAVLGATTTVTPPTTIAKTGAGSTVAIILVAVTALGAYAHRAFTLKRQ